MSFNLPEQALKEAALTALHKTMGETLTGVRTDMQKTLEDIGVERVAAKLPDGTKVASLTVSNPTPKPAITDEAAFVRFVEDVAPGEVMTIKVVRPAFAAKLIEEMEKRGSAEIVDPGNGEIIDVDGVEMKEARAATHSVTWEKEGRAALAAAWRAGLLSHIDGLPQLTAGGAE
ncbi:hypothetical protein [Streptomyces scabiei]|uniref:hypothetical protein n=1 Tax=Streptomyces scabiei TaxID=1930 RepID=UPI001B31A3C0|nr:MULTISPECIES: hypothetical protein [unclassified Streptomyces]MBP5896378.1 hypothetical protein [Streptomyces sp. LBUM 1481]MBP5926754.1 hypothetical protein [Streptomyces sp. LBUM 1483]